MSGNLVSRKDGSLPLTEDQMQAVGILDETGKLLNLGGLIKTSYDYVSVSYPDGVTEVYSFRLGGVSGKLVATITLVYTDSTKANLSTVAKT